MVNAALVMQVERSIVLTRTARPVPCSGVPVAEGNEEEEARNKVGVWQGHHPFYVGNQASARTARRTSQSRVGEGQGACPGGGELCSAQVAASCAAK